MTAEILRTPDHCFDTLEGYAFAPHYLEVADPELGQMRVHYVDEGPRDGQVVVLMHGEPSWSYLYRTMIPPLVAAGHRVIAPDLIGFGRSDKPAAREAYSYEGHVRWMTDWFDQMALKNVTLFCQDWGGLIGLRIVAAREARFARVAAGNTFLPTGEGKASEAFLKWRQFSQDVPEFPAGGIIRGGTVRDMATSVEAAYNAPYPEEKYKSGARMFPLLVPITPEAPGAAENREAWKVLSAFEKPFLTLFSDQDPITKGGDLAFQKKVPGCAGQAHATIKNAGHFLQEDAGPDIAAHLIAFME